MPMAHIYAIGFQKSGFPHAHLLGPGKKLRDVGDVGERNLQRFLTLTFLPDSICSAKKVGDISSPIFPSYDFFTWPHVFY